MNGTPRVSVLSAEARRGRLLFGLLLLLQVAVYGWLILTRRLPKGHDTLSVYLLQYLFQAHAAQGAATLLWMPYFAHGVVSTWFAGLQGGVLQNSLLVAGGVPSGTPMLPLFYAGLFLEDLVLLIGIWHLGGRLYRRLSARFFVAAAAVGSSLWIDNIYWNHRLVYAVPLAASLIIDFLETGSRWRLFLAVGLMSLQLTGNALYIPVLSALSVGLFVAVYAAVHRRRLGARLSLLRPRPADALWLAAASLVVACVATALLQGLGDVRHGQGGRRADGSVSLDSFLTYPGGLNPLRYADFFLGVTPSLDYSLYCGLCTAALALMAFWGRPGKGVLHLGVTLLLLLFLSVGYLSVVGMLGYYAIYPMHYFRYIALAAPLVKLLVILLSGFGLEAFARAPARPEPSWGRGAIALGMLALAFAWMLALRLHGFGDPLTEALDAARGGLAVRQGGEPPGLGVFPSAAAVALAVAGLFYWRARVGPVRRLLPLLLILHVSDVFLWRLRMLREETVPLDDPLYALQEVRPIPYVTRRVSDYGSSRRYVAAEKLFHYGTTYDYVEAFAHLDPPWSRFFVTQWSPSIDLMLRARARRRLTEEPVFPPPLGPPQPGSRAFAKAVGEREDKLQVFSAAHVAGSDQEIADFMNRPDFLGDALLLSPPAAGASGRGLVSSLAGRNERLPVVPEVLEFAGDRIRIRADVPADRPEAWLVYCDAWHPGWRATVDGADVPVERANLAYKAVRLHAGPNAVEFRFRAPLRALCTKVVGLLSFCWCAVLAAWTLGLLGVGERLRRWAEGRRA